MINIIITIFGFVIFVVFGFRTANDFGLKISPKISLPFVEISQGDNRAQSRGGGPGGSVKIGGKNIGTVIGGNGGGGGPGAPGGSGGDVDMVGDNNGFAMGGEGGEAGQIDRGGKGGRGPLQVLMEDYPEKWKEMSSIFGLTSKDAMKYGNGGDGAGPTSTLE